MLKKHLRLTLNLYKTFNSLEYFISDVEVHSFQISDGYDGFLYAGKGVEVC